MLCKHPMLSTFRAHYHCLLRHSEIILHKLQAILLKKHSHMWVSVNSEHTIFRNTCRDMHTFHITGYV
jgi:hypothetical protein